MGIAAYVTDETVENEGIWQRFEGGFGLRLARAGGSNAAYVAAVAKRAEQFKTIDRSDYARSRPMAEVYAEAVIKDAEGDFTDLDGEDIEIGSEKLVEVLLATPELFLTIQGLASDRRYYRQVGGDPVGKSQTG